MRHCPWKAEPHGVPQNSWSRVNISSRGDRRNTTKQKKVFWRSGALTLLVSCRVSASSRAGWWGALELLPLQSGPNVYSLVHFFFLDWQEWRTLVLQWVYNGCLDVIYWSLGIAVLSNYFFPPAWRAPFAFRLTSFCLFELVPLYSKHPGFCEIKAGLVKVKGK